MSATQHLSFTSAHGLDVGKSSHWARLATRDGEIAVNSPVANTETELDELFRSAGEGVLVVVDQVRNIGALPVPKGDARMEAARSLASQRDHMVTCGTRDKNRLRSVLLESCPAFEALVDLLDSHWLKLLEKLGVYSSTKRSTFEGGNENPYLPLVRIFVTTLI